MARKESGITSFCAWDGETLVLNVLGTPSAKKDAIGKVKGDQLKVSVTATPVAGRATDHMVRFLAKEFGVTAKDIEVVFDQPGQRFHAIPRKAAPLVDRGGRVRRPGRRLTDAVARYRIA